MFRAMRSALSARRVSSICFRYRINALRAEVPHFPPGVVTASEAVATRHFHEKIDELTERKELKAEREELKKLITSRSMDKDLEIAIRNQITALGNEITPLMGLPPALPARLPQQPAAPTTNSGETTVCSRHLGKRGPGELSDAVGDQFESVAMFVQRVNERRFDEALKSFDKWVLQMSRVPDDPYCAPHKVDSSWGAKEWGEALKEGRKQAYGAERWCFIKGPTHTWNICRHWLWEDPCSPGRKNTFEWRYRYLHHVQPWPASVV